MIALAIHYLMGWASATDPTDYEAPEWPPHPARVFMALAAAHFETQDALSSEIRESERGSLVWLESQAAPCLRTSEAERGTAVTSFVPVNDVSISSRTEPTKALVMLPESRPRQPRGFPRAIPHEDTVWLIWPDAEAPHKVRERLSGLCERVTRIGHSSSVVQMWLEEDEVPAPNLVPDTLAPTSSLRTPGVGTLDALEGFYEEGIRPTVSLWTEYGPPADESEILSSDFDYRLLVLLVRPGESPYEHLDLRVTRRVIDYFRRAVISAAREPVPEYISGHAIDGSPSHEPHIAFLPLGFVGHRHADGHLLGLAVALPRGLSTQERARCEAALAALLSRPGVEEDRGRLRMGNLGRWRLEPVDREAPPYTLRAETWTAPSRWWASVTPVVLDRFTHDEDEKREIVSLACTRIGLPQPREVRLSPVSPWIGAPPSAEFGPLSTASGRPARPFTHVLLDFGEKNGSDVAVQGPVLIGAGRYRGYGVLRPYGGRVS